MDPVLSAELEAALLRELADYYQWQNVARFFDYDPFAHIPKEQATVGELRARAAAAGVDTRETSKAEYKRRAEARALANA